MWLWRYLEKGGKERGKEVAVDWPKREKQRGESMEMGEEARDEGLRMDG